MSAGMMYTARAQNVTVTNVGQNLWEIIAAAATSIVIHSIRIEFVPTIISGVGQDLRPGIAIATLASAGSGGRSITPAPVHPRKPPRHRLRSTVW